MKRLFLGGLLCLLPFLTQAQEAEASINSGDTAWMLMATALVALMTPAGLTLFYGGLTTRKSVLNTIGMSYVSFCIASIVWMLVGYSFAFGTANPFIGGFDLALLQGILPSDVRGTIPTLLFVVFQGTFAAIAVAIVSGSIIERVKFSTWLIFSALWVALVYSPIAHWVWGGGFLSQSGELDFAGGTVIHINAGISGLALALFLGKRRYFGSQTSKPASLKLMILGSALLWFGWFGFNGGSQLAADGIAANALLVTNLAACAGGITWMLIEWTRHDKKPTLLGSASGVVSGLVAITPAAGFVDASGSLIIGILGALVGYVGVVRIKAILGYDDTLDAFGIHGLVGAAGAILTGFFANPAINEIGTGALFGNWLQLWTQTKVVLVTIVYSAVVSIVLFKITTLITRGGRVHEDLEEVGMDEGYHGEASFNLNDE
ncbi:MAG: ammonium transporter [Cytophagales bacterium]|nr:ammonium transporter [Cytophagales bacterium]